MSGEVNSYLESVNRFFEGLRDSYRREKESYREKLSRFFEPLVFKYRVAKEIKRQTDRYLASDFNLVDIMNPDENKISDIIAELLNPNGKHGQGEIFLKKFLEVLREFVNPEWLSPESLELSCVTVDREHTTTESRRIDIFLRFSEGITVGIENKPWAGEQKNQLEDYVGYLREISEKGKFLLIYLDGWGREATSIKSELKEELKKEGKFVELSYRRFLIPWLKECFKECEAEKVRWFLRDFISWIENNLREEVSDGAPEKGNH